MPFLSTYHTLMFWHPFLQFLDFPVPPMKRFHVVFEISLMRAGTHPVNICSMMKSPIDNQIRTQPMFNRCNIAQPLVYLNSVMGFPMIT